MGFNPGYLGVLTFGGIELTNVTDVTPNLEAEQADATTRAGLGFKQTEPTLIDYTITFSMLWDDEDPGFAAIKAAFFGRTKTVVQALRYAGGPGEQADMKVVGFAVSEPLAEGITVEVTLKPCRGNPPEEI